MRFNLFAKSPLATFEGAPAVTLNAVQTLRRSVLSCLLWEDEFYEDGQAIADRIAYPVVIRPSYVLGGRAMAWPWPMCVTG